MSKDYNAQLKRGMEFNHISAPVLHYIIFGNIMEPAPHLSPMDMATSYYLDRLSAGYTQADIARELNCSRATISYQFRLRGIKTKSLITPILTDQDGTERE